MEQQKETADKEHATKERKKKKDKEDRKKAHRSGNGNSNSKYKIDCTATRGPTSKCKKHPNAKHVWGDCFLNPNNPNNKLDNTNNNNNSNQRYGNGNNQYIN